MKKGSKMTKAQRARISNGIRAARSRAAVTTFTALPLSSAATRERKPADPVAECVTSLVAAVREQVRAEILAKLSE